MPQEAISYGMHDPVNDSRYQSCHDEVFFSQKYFRLHITSYRQLLHADFAHLHPGISNGLNHINLDFLTRIFQWKNPASLRLRTAKGLLNLSRKENVSQTLSSSTSGLNPLPF